ncbi:MAG: hypothetical protein HY744_04910, partial [Deltaproteobacteria bacterium]|nr:hypothetical protein [Deltaproteobacteria bacterium]
LLCSGGTTKCGNACVDTKSDLANCGSCGNACPGGQVCSAGSCGLLCSGGTTKCGSSCVDIKNDPANCGSCGSACPGGQVCSAGSCGLLCSGGSTKCGNACADTKNDPANCGGCGQACAGGQVCSNGSCVLQCVGGTTKCGNACVDTKNDPANCGGCGSACPGGQICLAGKCTAFCGPGTTLCGNLCVDTKVDPANCGKCANACSQGQFCVSGQCTSPVKHATCNDLVTNQNAWGKTAKGVDLRAWTASTLHYLGCPGDGCSSGEFNCTYDQNTQTLDFGTNGGTVRSMVDPNNNAADGWPNGYGGCCTANQTLGLCNGPDKNNNGVPIDNGAALCNALGYKTGQLSSGTGNVCPEPHALTSDGLSWTSDFVNSDGFGYHWKCVGFK